MIDVLERQRMSLVDIKEKTNKMLTGEWIINSVTDYTFTLYKNDGNVTIVDVFVSSYTASITRKYWHTINDGMPDKLSKKFFKSETSLMDELAKILNS